MNYTVRQMIDEFDPAFLRTVAFGKYSIALQVALFWECFGLTQVLHVFSALQVEFTCGQNPLTESFEQAK